MKTKNEECITLANEIIDEFELSKCSTKSLLFKCLRLCRLLDDEIGCKLFYYELSGYSDNNKNVSSEAFEICRLSGRVFKREENGVENEYAKSALLPTLEAKNAALKIQLESSKDPNISISSANPSQYINTNFGNTKERNIIVKSIAENEELISKIEGSLYNYILKIRNSLLYSNAVSDVISSYKKDVDEKLKEICPEAISKFLSSYENLESNNNEDWSNAVHSCRRILKDVADHFYPVPTPDFIVIGKKTIKLDDEAYVNRLVQYISKSIDSKSKKDVVTTSLENIGNQIDSIYNSTNKGTHANVSKEDARRFVVYTYMLIGDILLLNYK